MQKINPERIKTFVNSLKKRGYDSTEIAKKLSSVDKFLKWALGRSILSPSDYKQLREALADSKLSLEGSPKVIASTEGEFKALHLKEKAINSKNPFAKLQLTTFELASGANKWLNGILVRKGGTQKKIGDQAIKGYDLQTLASNLDVRHYVGAALVLILIATLGAGVYNQFFQKPTTPLAFPTNLTRGGRTLSFQGRLTDSLSNPINAATNMRFRLYNAPTGGTTLYDTSTCSITPDQDGVFDALIGGSGYSPTPPQEVCGTEIPANIFSDWPNVYLGVTVGSDSEATPRQQIANVGYALNAETLQGFPPGTGKSNIPYLNSDGDLLIATAGASITSQYESANFTVASSEDLILQAAGPSGGAGDIILQATGSGALRLRTAGTTDSETRLFVANGGNVGIANTNPGAALDVAGNILVNNGGTIDTRAAGTLTIGGTTQTGLTLGRSGQVTTVAGTAKVSNLTTNGPVYTSGGDGTLNSEANLAIARGGTNGSATPTAGAVAYGTGTAYAFTAQGTTGECLKSATAGTPTWGSCGSGGIGGSGTTNFIPKFTDATTIGDSLLFDNGTNVGIATTGPDAKLDILTTAGEQLRLTYTDGSVYSAFTTDSSGNLNVDVTGTKVDFADDIEVSGNDILDSGSTSRITLGATTTLTNTALNLTGTATLTSNTALAWDLVNSQTSALNIESGLLNIDTSGGKIGIGTTTPTSKLHVTGAITGKALSIFDETGDQAPFVASAGGIPIFTINQASGTDANGFTFTSSATGNGVTQAATGTDSNVALSIDAKGSGDLNLNNTATGDVLLAGGSAGTGCTVANSTGNLTCAGDLRLNGNDIIDSGGTTRITLGATTTLTNTTTTLSGTTTLNGTSVTAVNLGAATIDFNGLGLLQYGNGSNFTIADDGGNNVFRLVGASDLIEFGNATDNNAFTFLGSGAYKINSLTTNGPVYTSGGDGTLNSEANLAIARGGTNGSATPTAGAVAYGTGTAYAFTAAGSGGECLQSAGAGTPVWASCATGSITGSGTTNFLAKFTSASAIGDSLIFDNGTNLGIATTGPDAKLDILTTAGEQLRLTYTDGTVYSAFTTNSSGNLNIDVTGTKVDFVDDIEVSGNDILDSGSTSRITLGSTTTLTNSTTALSGTTTLTASSLATFTTAATLGMTSTTTLNLGSNATLTSSATALNLQSDGAVDVNLAGGSGATGCTVANSTGNLTCSGNITGASTGTVGYWTRSGTTLSPATTGDSINVTGNTTLGDSNTVDTLTGNLLTSSITSGATTQSAVSLAAASLTTGEILDITGTSAPADGSTNEAIDINITHTPTSSPDNFRSLDLDTADGTALANTIYGIDSTLTLTGDAAKIGIGASSTVTSSSTTADTLAALDATTTVTGIMTTGTRNVYGLRSQPTAGAESTGGTTNVYGGYFRTSADVGAGGTVNGYGAYIANGTFDADGTSSNIGLYVEEPTGADSNYAAIFADGNVGIGLAAPTQQLTALQDDVGDIFGLYDGTNNQDFLLADAGVATFKPTGFDTVYTFDGVSTYTNNTTESKTNAGTAYTLLAAENPSDDIFYVGLDHPFPIINFDIGTAGAGVTLVKEYWNGATWTALTVTDNTSNLSTDGTITFTAPTDWATTAVNSVTKYWVRLCSKSSGGCTGGTGTNLTTAPTAFFTTPTTGNRFYVYGQSGDATPAFYINDFARVGVGTTTLSSTFTVNNGSNAINPLAVNDNGTAVFTIADVSGTAANGFTLTGAAAASGVTLAATGSDTNIALSIDAKGSGALNLNNTGTGDVLIAGGSGSTGCTITNSTGNLTCAGDVQVNGGDLLDLNGNEVIRFSAAGSAVNELTIGNAATAGTVTLAATGGDTDIALTIDSKGADALSLNGTATGDVNIAGGSGSTGCTIANSTGYITCHRFVDATGGGAYYLDPGDSGNSLVIAGNIDFATGTREITTGGDNALTVDTGTQTLFLEGGSSGGNTSVCVSFDGSTSCDGKLDAGTVDPPYTINGKKYATFMASMTGVKEETTGTVSVTEPVSGIGYRHVIDFQQEEEGSDLWLFSKTTNLKENISRLVPLLTPSTNTRVWYMIDEPSMRLIIYASRPTTVAYRLTAPRFDDYKWANTRDGGGAGHIINDQGILTGGDLPNPTAEQHTVSAEQGQYIVRDSLGQIIYEIGSFSKATIGSLQAGILAVQEVGTNSLSAVTASIQNLTVTDKIISPVVETGQLKAQNVDTQSVQTGKISPKDQDLEIDLSNPANPQAGELAKLIIRGTSGQEVATINAEGDVAARNATLSGTLTAENVEAKDASFSGKITAAEIDSQNIRDFRDRLENVVSQASDLGSQTSTVTQQTSNLSEQVNQIQTLLADLQNQPLPDSTYYQSLPASVVQGSVDSENNLILQGYNSVAMSNLAVTGNANLYNAYVVQSLGVGDITVSNGQIASLNSELKISALSTINFMDGAVTISRDGTLTTRGAVIAQGGVKTNDIKPLSDADNLNVTLNGNGINDPRFVIRNSSDEVASINASGSARFKNLSLDSSLVATQSGAIIAASENYTKNGLFGVAIETQAESAGLGLIPTNESEIIIYNSNIKENTLIYLTPTGPVPSGQLTVAEKHSCPPGALACKAYFKVSVGSSNHPEIKFNWLTIN